MRIRKEENQGTKIFYKNLSVKIKNEIWGACKELH